MEKIDLRHLRYFVAVAEEGHFGRAAERLGIRQPPLSIQIRQLEEMVGARLFRRLSRGVALTAAGQAFLEDARALLAGLERAVVRLRRHAQGEAGHLRLGFAGATYFHPAITAAIRDYRGRYPAVVLSPEQSNTPALLAGLHEERLDVAFVRPPVEADDRLVLRPVAAEEMVAVVPAGHRLEAPGPLDLADASAETFILFPRAIGPGLHDTVISACHRAGFSPRLGQEASQIASIIPLVAAGFGISIVPRSLSQIQSAGVVYRPLAGPGPQATIALASRRDDASALTAAFVAAVMRACALADRSTGRIAPPGTCL